MLEIKTHGVISDDYTIASDVSVIIIEIRPLVGDTNII